MSHALRGEEVMKVMLFPEISREPEGVQLYAGGVRLYAGGVQLYAVGVRLYAGGVC